MAAGKASKRFAVLCNKHGADFRGWKAVFVAAPTNRGTGKNAGCPNCKAERTKGS